MTAREMIRRLEGAGWQLIRIKGSHHLFRHPDRPDPIVVPVHRGDLKKGLEQAILKQAGL